MSGEALPLTPHVYRPLYPTDFMYFLTNKHSGAVNLMVAGELVPKQQGETWASLEEPNILSAIAQVCRLHCHLQLTVKDGLQFMRHDLSTVPDSYFGDVVIHRNETFTTPDAGVNDNAVAASQQAFEQHLNALKSELFSFSFSDVVKPPIIRVGVLRLAPSEKPTGEFTRYGLVVVIPHYIGDMQGATNVFLDLAAIIRGIPIEGKETKMKFPPGGLDLVPKHRRGMFRFLFRGGLGAVKDNFKNDPRVLFGQHVLQPPVDGKMVQDTSIVRKINAEHVNALHAEAKKRNIKLQGVIMAATALAHAATLPIHGNEKLLSFLAKEAAKGNEKATVRINTMVPVDVRRRVTPILPGIVASVSYSLGGLSAVQVRTGKKEHGEKHGEKHVIDIEEFWSVAEHAHVKLHREIENGDFWWMASTFESLPMWLMKMAGNSKAVREPPKNEESFSFLSIANIGRIDDGNDNPASSADLKDVAVFFNTVVGLYVSAISGSAGMTLSFTGGLKTEAANRFADTLVEILLAVAAVD